MDSLYEAIGGAEGLRSLVDHFYDAMDSNADVRGIRDMHAKNLQPSRDKLYEFLSGWTGGPNLYVEKHGHPRLRARHLPFKIDDKAAMDWMACMKVALDTSIEDEALREQLYRAFARIAVHMRNQ